MIRTLLLKLQSARTPLLIAIVVLSAIGVIAYVQIAVKHIEQELPLRVMREKRDMEAVARHFYNFLVATEAALAHPTKGNIGSIKDNLNTVERDLQSLREHYTFNTLIGASALHAAMTPAVDDVRIWLTQGFGELKPNSPILLELVATRIRDTLSKVFDKTTEADRIAYEILEQQSAELTQLRNRLFLVLTAVVLLAGGVIWFAVRQRRISRDRETAETAERLAQARFQEALESTSEGFAFFDPNELLVIANTRYTNLFLNDVREIVTPGVSFETILRTAVDSGMITEAKDDSERWLAWRLKRFRQPSGPFAMEYSDGRWVQINERTTGDGGTVVIYSDITELKRREFELLQAKEDAETISEAKSSFLANVSHELRTPLTSILGFARIIQKRLETIVLPKINQGERRVDRAVEQVRNNLAIMLVEGDRLTKLVNDVLDLEKIEAGQMVWNIAPFDVGEVVDQASSATESLYRQKGLEFRTEIARGIPQFLGDRDRVVQVLVNLISNAVKFTDTGCITCRADSDEEDRVVISISDTGCGIAPDDRKAVFEKFRQVGDTLTEKPAGTGLGLPICREIIDHLGGEITVESTPGRGSTFTFWLPAVRANVTAS